MVFLGIDPGITGAAGRKQTYLSVNCFVCGTPCRVRKNNFKRGVRPSCSAVCCNRLRGVLGKNFKGRKFKRGSKGGAILVYAPGHPSAKKNYVYEHRLIMEKHLGRHLRGDEYVHHIDSDDHNNSIENLIVVSNRQHKIIHAQIQGLLKPLMARGLVRFDKEKMEYVLCTLE